MFCTNALEQPTNQCFPSKQSILNRWEINVAIKTSFLLKSKLLNLYLYWVKSLFIKLVPPHRQWFKNDKLDYSIFKCDGTFLGGANIS